MALVSAPRTTQEAQTTPQMVVPAIMGPLSCVLNRDDEPTSLHSSEGTDHTVGDHLLVALDLKEMITTDTGAPLRLHCQS